MSAEQDHTVPELDEALSINPDDYLYLVKSPYGLLNSFKLRASTLASWLIAGAAGDMFGPASSVDGTIPLFDGNTGKIVKASTYTPASLLNRANHVGQQAWSTIDSTPTTLLGYGILDGTGPITIKDEGTTKTTKVTSMDFVGSSVLVTNVDGAVTVTIEAAGANTMLLDEAQLNTGIKTFADATLLVRNNAGTASHTIKSAATASRIVTIPDTTDTIVTLALAQTLTNKTLTTPIINAGSDAGGDMYFRNGTTFTRLPIGTAGQSLVVSGGLPSWQAGVPLKVNIITSGLALSAAHEMISCDSATDFTIALPDAATNTGRRYYIKNKNLGIVTLDATGVGNLFTTSSLSSITMLTGDSYWVISDGSTWTVS